MNLDLITDTSVAAGLWAIRYGRDMLPCGLCQRDLVTLRLRESGLEDTRCSREWALMGLLTEIVESNLARVRQHDARHTSGYERPPEDERALLVADFRSGCLDRETWSLLYHRYISPTAYQMQQLALLSGQPRRTLTRRLARGHRAIVRVLRDAECGASCELTARNQQENLSTRGQEARAALPVAA
jgi:hypothetical protein